MAKVNSTGTTGGLNADEVALVREMLLIGLASYGEIERLRNVVELAKIFKEKFPEELNPIHPTGSADTVSDFADALRCLKHAEVAHG